ncbi:hypothetical protein GF342_03875 [Candidatus Woesearchaeota archaeon]|nr:hypothetical protein [Candidatus Woesearchaeota archaeon]
MKELFRKLFHMLVGLLLIAGYFLAQQWISLTAIYYLLFVGMTSSLVIDAVLAHLNWSAPGYKQLQRQHERNGIHSNSYFLLGTLLSFIMFEQHIALAAILMLIFGDALAALVGKRWGTPFLGQKSIEGSLTMFVVSLIVGLFVVESLPVVFIMAITAMIAERFSGSLDDNVMIPLFAGLTGSLL